jgi:hypothetical protein
LNIKLFEWLFLLELKSRNLNCFYCKNFSFHNMVLIFERQICSPSRIQNVSIVILLNYWYDWISNLWILFSLFQIIPLTMIQKFILNVVS